VGKKEGVRSSVKKRGREKSSPRKNPRVVKSQNQHAIPRGWARGGESGFDANKNLDWGLGRLRKAERSPSGMLEGCYYESNGMEKTVDPKYIK